MGNSLKENEKPTPEKFGWHEKKGFDDEPSGWMFEGGEDAYNTALKLFDENKYINFLKSMVSQCYHQGDNFHAQKNKNGYFFGYSNDYHMQHGKGLDIILPEKFVHFLYNKINSDEGKNI